MVAPYTLEIIGFPAMSIYIPYTYLIGWSDLKKYYYGVRYAKGCDPSDLWVDYKTSSKVVHRIAEEHGDPDIMQIRKTFDNARDAREWEHKVLIGKVARKDRDVQN